MHKILFYLLFIVVAQSYSYAQISGTKTIGGTGADYSNISSAVAALNSNGVSGPVTFNINSGTYSGNFVINNISGASATNTITFQSTAHDSSLVLIQSASSTSSNYNYVAKFNSTKYTNFKWVTFERTGTESNASVMELSGVCNNNSFEHCVFKNGITSSSSFSTSLVYAANTGNNISYITLNNNYFQNGSIGIYMQGGSSTSINAGASITNNVFSNQYRWVLALYYQDAPVIEGNTITSSSTYYDFRAIYSLYSMHDLSIKNNKISATKGYGIRMENSIGSINAGLVTNNFISFSGSGAYAMYYSNSGSHNIYYNSINISGSSATGMFINGQTSSNIRLQNNIFKIGSTGNCMSVDQSTNFPFLISDNNDFYFPQGYIGKWKTTSNISTLSAWRTASNWDYNSVNFDPNFVSNTDLHINGYSNISKKGTSSITTPSVSIDIDGTIRNSVTPDIGADEFTYEDFSISNVNINSTYCTGETESISAYLVNLGNTPYNSNMDLSYQLGSNAAIVESMAININAGDSQLITFTNPVSFNNAGSINLSVKHLHASDQNPSNDELITPIVVNQTPSINWPLDSLVCASHTVLLDAGAGMDSYLWSTGATSQTISVDTSGIGFGARYFKVDISLNGCSTSDSILINFVYCSGIDNALDPNEVDVYPNPTEGKIFVNSTYIFNNAQVEVYSTSGKLVMKSKISNNSFDISELNTGLYFVLIRNKSGYIYKSILKN